MSPKKAATVLGSSSERSDAEQFDRLTSTVDILAQEVRVLREAVDELREVLDWTMKNRDVPTSASPCLPVTSVLRDPHNNDPGDRIIPTTPDDMPATEETTVRAAPGELF